MAACHDIPFAHDDGGQADEGIVSALSDEQLEVVRVVAIVTDRPFAEVHALGAQVAGSVTCLETFAGVVTREFGLEEVGLFGDDETDLLDVVEFAEDSGVREIMLCVLVHGGHGHRHVAIVGGVQRGTEALPVDVDDSEVSVAWVPAVDADRLDGPDEDDGPLDDGGLL